MLYAALILFFTAIVFGLIILTNVLQNEPSPKSSVLFHGACALTGVLLVIIYMFLVASPPLLITSVTLFVIAALGGLTLFMLDIKTGTVPKLLAILHPLVALAGLITLVIYILP